MTGPGRPGSLPGDPAIVPGGAYGASAERTRLAWRRTNLAGIAIVLLTVRLASRAGLTPLGAAVIAITLAGWLVQLWLTHRRIQAMAHREPAGIGRTLPATAFLVVGAALLGLLLVVTQAG